MPNRSIRPSLTISRPPPPPSSAGWKITTAVPEKLRVSARYLAPPSSIAVCPSCPQACILPGLMERYGRLVCSSMGSASMSARRPTTFPAPCPLPRITPTTPVLPMPAMTSSAEGLQLLDDARRGALHVEHDFRMSMDIAPPCGDLRLHVGDPIDD